MLRIVLQRYGLVNIDFEGIGQKLDPCSSENLPRTCQELSSLAFVTLLALASILLLQVVIRVLRVFVFLLLDEELNFIFEAMLF